MYKNKSHAHFGNKTLAGDAYVLVDKWLTRFSIKKF